MNDDKLNVRQCEPATVERERTFSAVTGIYDPLLERECETGDLCNERGPWAALEN